MQCEHHLLPFYGMTHIAYLPTGGAALRRLTLAQLEAVVAMYSKRLQIQARLFIGSWDSLNRQGNSFIRAQLDVHSQTLAGAWSAQHIFIKHKLSPHSQAHTGPTHAPFSLQERLTQELAGAVEALANARGVLVVVEALHMCMVARGVEKHASSTTTVAARGSLAEDGAARSQLLLSLCLS